MARAAAQAAEAELDINSPSKVGYRIGGFFGMGFVNSLIDYTDKSYDAGASVAKSAKEGLRNAVSKIGDFIENGIDSQPTIRPLLDLSDVTEGAGRLSALLSRNQAMKISAGMERDGASVVQNGGTILERRIIWGQRIFNGNLQNGIQTMLNECIISPSIADRKISNFVFVPSTDPKITSLKIDNQYTGDCLYDVVKGLCEENNIGFKIVLTDENKFAFSLYAGVDRSYEQTENPYVVFSPNFENIINSNYYSSRASFRNVTLVAGEGEGAARRTAIVGSASGLDRRELFTDARDISSDTEDGTLSDAEYMAQLRTKGLKNLADHIVTTAFEGEVEVTRLFKYGEDFFIGDIVQIANEYGNEGSAYISELVISNSEEGLSIYPTFKTISK